MDGFQALGMQPDWLKAELAKPGRSQSALARFLGMAPEQVNRMCKGARKISADEADKIRSYLAGTSASGATLPHISPRPVRSSLMPVRGTVEAGSWREVPFSDVEYQDAETIPAPPGLVEMGAFALRVAGPSMNLRFPEGSWVIVMPFNGGPMPVGKRVVVERARSDGLIETTVKDLVRNDAGDLELWPRSTHPAHQAPIPYKDVDGVTVRVIGTVHSVYQLD